MPQVPDTRKVFNFAIEIDGVNQFEVQKCKIPKAEIEKVRHGDTNHDIKTAGRVEVDDMTWEKIRPASGSDTWAWDWLKDSQNMVFGGGNLSSNVKRTVIVKEYSNNGSSVVNRWICTGVWCCSVDPNELDRQSSDNMIETLGFSVDEVDRI